MIPALPFYIFGALAIAFSFMVVFKKNPVSSAFSLVIVFFCFAAIYAALGAHLVAALQILVYAGAIMVLFVFVIMLLNADKPTADLSETPLPVKIMVGLSGLGILSFLVIAFKSETFWSTRKGLFTPEFIDANGGNSQIISELIFSEYLLPFELTSVLLLASIVGAVALAKRNQTKGKT